MSDQFQHSVTQFYQRAWAIPPELRAIPGFLKNRDGTITRRDRISVARTGGAFGLYGMVGVAPEEVNYLEREFFTPVVDHPGHAVLAKLRTDELNTLTDDERFAWTIFFNAQRLRGQTTVANARAKGPSVLMDQLERGQAHYDTIRKSHDPATLRDYLDQYAPAMKDNIAMVALLQSILKIESLEAIHRMTWGLLDFSSFNVRLLTSDNPMWGGFPLDDPSCLLALPISPTKLFVATPPQNVDYFLSHGPYWIAEVSNRAQCYGAIRWVYGNAPMEYVRTWAKQPG